MPTEVFDIDGVNSTGRRRLMKWMDELAREVPAGAQRAMMRAAHKARNEVIAQIDASQPRPPVDTGQMRRSWIVRPNRDWLGANGAVLENTVEHTVFMEEGIRPTLVPIAPLLEWAVRKTRGKAGASTVMPIAKGKRRRKGGAKAQRARDARALAYGAQRSIARRGIKGRFFFKRASAKFVGFVEEAVREELDKLR